MIKKDRKWIWHPFTQEKTADPPIFIKHGKNEFLFDAKNNRLVDLISSWWVNLHGHAHPTIAQAIYKQSQELEHVIFAGFTHKPAVTLCEKLSKILPSSLERFFFSDNGSTAVEVALKIAYQYWQNHGDTHRCNFLCFEGGYHGDTFGAMSCSKSSGFHDPFQKLFFPVHTIPFPATWIDDKNCEKKEKNSLKTLEAYLDKHGSKTAAVIVEPLLQGASGMRICRPTFLNQAISIIKKHKILVIFDEILTGFFRTGSLFAFHKTEVIPDILCLSKGLTGGFLPLALTVVTNKIYEAFLDNSFAKAFAHGHSYTAHPLGCAAASASIDLLTKPALKEKIVNIEMIHVKNLKKLQKNARVKAVRQIGTLAAFNLDTEETIYTHPLGSKLKKNFIESGLLLRPLGNTIYLLPPYCIDEKVLTESYDKILKILCSFK